MLQYFHTVHQLFMNLELVQIIAPFETDSDLCFVNANGLLKTCLCSQQMEFVFRHVLSKWQRDT